MNPKLPGTYVNLLADVLQRKGISNEQLLDGTGISAQKLESSFWYVDFHIFNYLLEKSALLIKEPAIGIILAKEMKASCYGHVGVAAVASQNLGEAIEILEQYISLFCSVFKPQLKVDKDNTYIFFNQPLYLLDFNYHFIIFLTFGFAYTLESLAQQKFNIKVELKQSFSELNESLKNKTHIAYDFNREINRLSFKTEFLHLPLNSADKTIARLSRAICESYIKNKILQRTKGNGVAKAVIETLYDERDGFLSFKEVAKKMYMSERTLQRQLSCEQTSFSRLVTEVKQTKAEYLLKRKNIPIDEIAYTLGYADLSHFSRAFKKWTNVTPKSYRVHHAY
ncbi:helix-turn-helix domain-containing protein [Acinetobacter ursingii]|uniref:AraC family transcriptional regulator n=1 Tax=Acinetobacter ursingii TaxID=108980 RepID=UPI003AF41939